MSVTLLFAEAQLVGALDERARRRLGERARSRMVRAVAQHGASPVELAPAAVLAVWGGGADGDAVRAARAAEALRAELAQLGEQVVLRAALDVATAADAGDLLAGDALARLTALQRTAGGGGVLVGAGALALIGDAAVVEGSVLVDGSHPAPPVPLAPDERPAAAEHAAPVPADLPEAPDEALVALFNARAWGGVHALFAPGFRMADHRPAHAEDGWGRDEVLAGMTELVDAAPDAQALIERWIEDDRVAGGVLRIAGHRMGRPFQTAHVLLLLTGPEGVAAAEAYPLADRAAAHQRLLALAGQTEPEPEPEPSSGQLSTDSGPNRPLDDQEPEPEPAERHAAQMARWSALVEAGELSALAGELTEDFVSYDHRAVTGAGERDRDAFLRATASSLEMVPGLRVEAELLAVDGERRVVRLAYLGDDLRMTTFVLGVLDGDRLARQDVYDDAQDALDALAAAAVG
jgi:hypothetical protein